MQATTTFKHFTPLRDRKIKIKVLNQNSLHLENSFIHNSAIQDAKIIQRQNSQGMQFSKHNLTQNSTDVGEHSYKNNRSISQYLNTDITDNKQNSNMYLATEQSNLVEYSTTQDVNQFRIKKNLPFKSKRPKSSIGCGKREQKLLIKQSVINNYITSQYGLKDNQQNQPSFKRSKSRKKNEKSQKILNLYKNYQADGNKSVIDVERKRNDNISNKRLRSSEGQFIKSSVELNRQFLSNIKVQINEIEKLMQIIDDKYYRKSDSLETIIKEVDMIDQKMRQIEVSIRNIQQRNIEQDDQLRIQSILSIISNLQYRIQNYLSMKQQNSQMRVNSQHSLHNSSMQNIYNNSNYNDCYQEEKQRNFAEYIFDRFNNTLKIISNLKTNQVNEALDLMLQLNQELQIISNTAEVSYSIRAQSLQDLYELDCQIPYIFSLLMKILNKENDSEGSAFEQESLNQNSQGSSVQKSMFKPISKNNQQLIEQLNFGYQNYYTKINQENILNKDSYTNLGSEQQDQSIFLQDNDINLKNNQINSNVFRVSNGINKFKQVNRSQSKYSAKSLQNQAKPKMNKSFISSNTDNYQQNENGTIYSNTVQKNGISNLNQSFDCKSSYVRQDSQFQQDSIKLESQIIENSQLQNIQDKSSLSYSQINQSKLQNQSNLNNIQNNDNNSKWTDENQASIKNDTKQSKQIQNDHKINNMGLKTKSQFIVTQKDEIGQQQSLSQSKSEYLNKNEVEDNLNSQNSIKPEILEMFKQIRVLIQHQNSPFCQRIIKQLVDFLEKSEYQDKKQIIDILSESLQYFNQIIELQIYMHTTQQIEMFSIDDEVFWNQLQDIHKQKNQLVQIRRKLHQLLFINDLYNEDKQLEIEIQDFNDLRQVVLRLVEKTDFPLLSIALPNNLTIHENIVNEIRQRITQTQEILKEVIEILSDVGAICQRQTFGSFKLITFFNPFFSHSDQILQLLNTSSIQHFSLVALLDLYSKLKKQFQKEKQISKLKQIVDRLLFIRLYDELITKTFRNIEQEIINILERGDINLKVFEQRLNKLFQSTNEIRILLLDNNYDFNRIDNFRATLKKYIQLITLYISIYNTNESSFVSGRDQGFQLIEQVYSFMFFTKSLSQPQPVRSKSPIGLHQTPIRNQSYSNSDSYYYYHIKKIQPQTIKDIRKRIEIYLQQLITSQERLQNFNQQHEQQIQNAQQLQNSLYDKTRSSQEQKTPQLTIKEIFQTRLIELSEKLNILIQQVTSLLQKPQILVIDLLHLIQGITEYLIIKKEDIAIVQNEQEKTIFVIPYNFGADCDLIVQQISNFMHHNNQQSISNSMKSLQPPPQTDIQAPTGPIALVYSTPQPQIIELYIYNNCPTDSHQVGELVISSVIDGQILFQNYVETNNEILKLQLKCSHPYIIANVKFADFKQKQSIIFQSDISIMELSKKDLYSNEKLFKVIIQQTDLQSIIRQSLQYFIHVKNNTQNEYIINQETTDPHNFVQKETTNDTVTITIKQNKMYEYTLYANLVMSDVFQIFKNGKVALNQVNITQIRQDNPHTWKIFQIPKLKTRSSTSKK